MLTATGVPLALPSERAAPPCVIVPARKGTHDVEGQGAMTRVRKKSLRLSAALIGLGGAGALPAAEPVVADTAALVEEADAETETANSAQVGAEITVTARRREERAQDVPWPMPLSGAIGLDDMGWFLRGNQGR